MFGQLSLDVMLLLMLYAAGTATAFIACLYLLLRQGNAFARRVKTPDRLRLWTAAFFGIVAAGHLWYLPASMTADNETATLWMLIGGLLDCLLMIPVAIVVLLCMLQDRRRPLWPVWVAVAPLVIMMAVSVGMRSYDLLPWMRGYLLLVGIGLMVYMVRAVYQYGHWLRDNFADLEHKEVWQSFVVLAVVMLMLGIYASGDGGMDYEFLVQVCALVLIVYLLWRVETLQDLSISQIVLSEEIAGPVPDDIECLLRQHCEAKQLFLISVSISRAKRPPTTPISTSSASIISSGSIARPSLPAVPSLPSSWPGAAATVATAPSVWPSSSIRASVSPTGYIRSL